MKMDVEEILENRYDILEFFYDARTESGLEVLEIKSDTFDEKLRKHIDLTTFNIRYLTDGGYLHEKTINEGNKSMPAYYITAKGIELFEKKYLEKNKDL